MPTWPSPMLLWFSRLPLTLRLPLLVAAMIFIAAVVTTQVAVRSTSAQFEDQIERIGWKRLFRMAG